MPTGEDPSFCEPLTLEQKTSTISGASGKVSLWMQWMLPKLTVKLFAPDPTTKTGKAVLSFLQAEETVCSVLSLIIYTYNTLLMQAVWFQTLERAAHLLFILDSLSKFNTPF